MLKSESMPRETETERSAIDVPSMTRKTTVRQSSLLVELGHACAQAAAEVLLLGVAVLVTAICMSLLTTSVV